MSVAENIKYLRKQKHMTQKQLSEKTGLAVITIQQYEAGKYSPKHDNLIKLATALECEVSDIDESIIVIPLPKYELTPERLEKARLDAEARQLIEKFKSGESLTDDEHQKISDYSKRIKESFSQLPERIGNIKSRIDKIGENILLADYRELNAEGQSEARKRVSELTEIPRYTKPDEPPQE